MSANQSDLTEYDVDAVPEDVCIRYERCGNIVPGRGQMCGECLDEVRVRDHEVRGGQL